MSITIDGIGADPEAFVRAVSPRLIAAGITTRALLNAELDALVEASFPQASPQVRARWKFILRALFETVSFLPTGGRP